MWVLGSNSGRRAWQEVPLLAEPFRQLRLSVITAKRLEAPSQSVLTGGKKGLFFKSLQEEEHVCTLNKRHHLKKQKKEDRELGICT